MRALETEQQISFLYGTCVGRSGERGPNLGLVSGGGMRTECRRTNSTAKESAPLTVTTAVVKPGKEIIKRQKKRLKKKFFAKLLNMQVKY